MAIIETSGDEEIFSYSKNLSETINLDSLSFKPYLNDEQDLKNSSIIIYFETLVALGNHISHLVFLSVYAKPLSSDHSTPETALHAFPSTC